MTTTTDQALVLTMIVRNESAIIERCLESARDLISRWVIVDTGSDDDTIALIKQSLGDIPGELHERQWVNFEHNRNELLDLSRGQGTHLLLLDADMTLRVESDLPLLDADAYLLRHDGGLTYWTPRIIRSDFPWSFKGVTHEYLTCTRPQRSERLDCLVLEHHGDGSSRTDKFERDRELLEKSLLTQPDDSRDVFYLAQTLQNRGESDAAVELFRRRIELGGWDQEVFYSQFQIGRILGLTDWDSAVPEFLRAWNYRPSRAEPLLELARGHRARGEYADALMFAEQGLGIPRSSDVLFVHTEAWDWALLFEFAIAAFHVGRVDDALAANEQLLENGVPGDIGVWVRHNRAWCLRALDRHEPSDLARLPLRSQDPLPPLLTFTPGALFRPITIDGAAGWSTFNPSITADPLGGFAMSVRSSNYRIGPGGHYDFAEEDGDRIVRTMNHFLTLDAELEVVHTEILPLVPRGPEVQPSTVSGYEDLRIIASGDRWRSTGTVRDRNARERCEIGIGDLGLRSESDRSDTSIKIARGPDPERHEKNWMPFVSDSQLHVVYLCDPVTVLTVDDDDDVHAISTTEAPPGVSGFRGGSQGIAFDDGFLFVIHEVTVGETGRRYAHRFMMLTSIDDHWTVSATTAPFHFIEPGIEFCAGLARDRSDLLLSFGVHDRSAWLCRVPADQVRAMLVPLVPG
ncbi:unannotated protein [freshwater metagenome]|uniref:Unannotated protein n=1 Tax=freshwater metagenome TaxID=449393 RepID=A0A6J6H674_9ZZZZ|nr:glycosyltransferase [Actinomycetota bacterium]